MKKPKPITRTVTKVLTIGGATQDIFIMHEDPQMLRFYSKEHDKEFLLFEEGTKIEIDKLNYYTGGGATNSATSFSRLGFNTSVICKTGHDCQADLVLKKLIQENIDTSYITQSEKLLTGTSIIIPSLTGERTVLAYRGANTDLQKSDMPENLIKTMDQLYITSLSGQSSKLLPYITQLAKKHNIPVATNPGISQLAAGAQELIKSLQYIDIFILNKHEATELMHSLVKSKVKPKEFCFSLEGYFCEILQRGPKIVVVTDGANGVYVAHEDTIYFHPSLPAKVALGKTISTLGAGDSFGSCFTACIASGLSIQDSMLRGIVNSSSVISYLDAKTGLLTKNQLEKAAQEISTKHMSQSPLISPSKSPRE
ncbi:carbohydrate kinase family protein [Candidatus Dependentiae bacterium]